jgi:hypothetical protein
MSQSFVPGSGGLIAAQGMAVNRESLPPMMQATDRLANAIEGLDTNLNRLLSKINPVLAPIPAAPPGSSPAGPPVAGSCQLTLMIHEQAARVHALARMIGEMHDRCEL